MLYKKHKVFSEKLTSVDDPIAVVQRGTITFVPSKGKAFLIPCFIENVVGLRLTPMSAQTQKWMFGSNGTVTATGWFSDLAKYRATNAASSGFGSIASAVAANETGRRLRIYNGKLYVANASLAATSAENTELSTTASLYWKKQEAYGSNGQYYLRVDVGNGASYAFKAKKQSIAYEVVGYEY